MNFLIYSGLWTQPFVLAGLLRLSGIGAAGFFTAVPSHTDILLLSFCPALYIWSTNSGAKRNGKRKFGIFDAFSGRRDPAYQPTLGGKARYPDVDGSMLSAAPEGCVLFGRHGKKYVRKPLDEDGHVLVVGGSGSGKSSCLVIPTLIANRETGVFAVDIKGELSFNSAPYDDEKTVIFNPSDRSSYGYDPFYTLGENAGEQKIMECMKLVANSLIPMPAGISDPFWKQSARTLLTGLLIYFYKKGCTTLPDICSEILAEPMGRLLEKINGRLDRHDVEASFLSPYVGLADTTLSGITSEMTVHIMIFATDQNIRFSFRENPIKMSPAMLNEGRRIFLSVKEELLAEYYDVFQLVINQMLAELEQREGDAAPVLFIIDELPRILSQGKIEKLIDAARTLRSRRVTLFLVTQSVEALLSAYRESDVDDLMSNCSYTAVLGASAEKTQRKIIKWAGQYKEIRQSYNAVNGGGGKKNVSYEEKDIVTPDDLIKLPYSGEMILISPHGYCRIRKVPYYRDAGFRKKASETRKRNSVTFS